jgi:hypothetical protein
LGARLRATQERSAVRNRRCDKSATRATPAPRISADMAEKGNLAPLRTFKKRRMIIAALLLTILLSMPPALRAVVARHAGLDAPNQLRGIQPAPVGGWRAARLTKSTRGRRSVSGFSTAFSRRCPTTTSARGTRSRRDRYHRLGARIPAATGSNGRNALALDPSRPRTLLAPTMRSSSRFTTWRKGRSRLRLLAGQTTGDIAGQRCRLVNRRNSWHGPGAPDPELRRGTVAGRFGFNTGGSRCRLTLDTRNFRYSANLWYIFVRALGIETFVR